MSKAIFIPPIFDRQGIERLARCLLSSALLPRRGLRRVTAALADTRVRGYRLRQFGVDQSAEGEVRGNKELVGIAIRPAFDQLGRPSAVRQAGVELILGLVMWESVERGYAADDETLTFQLDG